MPTFSTITFENLLEPRVRDSYKKPLDLNSGREMLTNDVAETPAADAAPRHIYISPALYTTPESTPIPDHLSEPTSPSPYVVNRKRRGGGAGNGRSNGFEFVDDGNRKEESGVDAVEEVAEQNFDDGKLLGDAENRDVDEDVGEFLDSKCESVSIGSTNERRQFDCRSFLSSQGEFFDAIEDFSLDNSSPSTPAYGRSFESESHAVRLGLHDEIERRRNAEEALELMQNRWQRLSNLLSAAGLTFPSTSDAGGVMPCENASMEELCQEIVVTRFVAEAMGKVQGRVEAEEAGKLILESKDQEISRLHNRLKYYEAMTHEMSQRNLETVGVARKQRQRRKTQRRLLWSCVGLSVAVGISVLGYPYLPDISKYIGFSHTSDGCSQTSPSEAV